MDILNDFGVNWPVLVASIVNFAILAVVLWFVMVKPLLQLMEQREQTIETSLKRAELNQQEAKVAEDELATKRAEAAATVKQIVDDAAKRADQIVARAKTEAEQRATEIVKAAEQKAISERTRLMSEATQQLAMVVVDATRLVVGTTVTDTIDQAIVAESLTKVQRTP